MSLGHNLRFSYDPGYLLPMQIQVISDIIPNIAEDRATCRTEPLPPLKALPKSFREKRNYTLVGKVQGAQRTIQAFTAWVSMYIVEGDQHQIIDDLWLPVEYSLKSFLPRMELASAAYQYMASLSKTPVYVPTLETYKYLHPGLLSDYCTYKYTLRKLAKAGTVRRLTKANVLKARHFPTAVFGSGDEHKVG